MNSFRTFNSRRYLIIQQQKKAKGNNCERNVQKTSVDNGHILIRAENTVIGHAQLLHFGLVPRIGFTSAYLKRSWRKQSNM